jgi:histone-lysine N-methyltransferase SETD3
MAKTTEVSKKIIANKLDLLSPKHSFLSTYLLREKKNPASEWKPYLDILPSDYDCFPIFFPQEDLDWLKGSPFLSIITII